MRLSCSMLSFFLLASPAFGQAAPPVPSGEWQPLTTENAQAFQQAEADFAKAVREQMATQRREGGGRRGPGGGMGGGPGNGPPPGGMRGGGARPAVPRLSGLVPREVAFAAPLEGTLVLERMREAVVFGNGGDDGSVVIVPFAGNTDLGNGVHASVHDESGRLLLRVDTADGRRLIYRYSHPDGAQGALQVGVAITAPGLGGAEASFKRVYRRVNVRVDAPQPAKP